MKPAHRNIYGDTPHHDGLVGVGYPPAENYWSAVTDVTCPLQCGGTVRWHEAGFVPGWRRCDTCGQHYCARGTAEHPRLYLAYENSEGSAGPHHEVRFATRLMKDDAQ